MSKRQKPALRGLNPFKQRDVMRTIRSAEAAGLAVAAVEIVTKDGVTIRVVGKRAKDAPAESPPNPWDQVLAP
jgi:hypothetical protein